MSYSNILHTFWVGCKIWALFFQPGEIDSVSYFFSNEYPVPKIKKCTNIFDIS